MSVSTFTEQLESRMPDTAARYCYRTSPERWSDPGCRQTFPCLTSDPTG
jgi:hypothetical protein